VNSLLEAWRDTLHADLRAFADRGSEPQFEVDGSTLRAAWEVRGQERDALFTLKAGDRFRWVSGPSEDDLYPRFLTSDQLADFRQLASAYAATVKRQLDFVASDAVQDDGVHTTTTTLSPDELITITDDARGAANGLTRLFFLKGDAGTGKTTLLREATVMQAERYLKGETDFLFLYVPAQGRELSNLRDAFSGELDELRAAFTRDAVAPLARFGVLVPIIDGFDELLGTAGYSGAFSSLHTLLGELDGSGTIVVSARSAFYDVEFLGRASGRRSEADMSITTLELRPWSDERLDTYILKSTPEPELDATRGALAALAPEDRELLRRPFFASQFEGYAAHNQDAGKPLGVLEHLITAYIERESTKIVNANGDPVLSVAGHRRLFELAVSEMWESESRQLSADDLTTISQLVSEEFGLVADQASQLTAKVTSYAGFRPRRAGPRAQPLFAFEHEVYFDYFLGCAIRHLVTEHRADELVQFLDRGVIPETVANFAMRPGKGAAGIDTSLMRCATGVSFENRRRNLGALVLAHARQTGELRNVTLRGLSFVDVHTGPAHLVSVTFDGCQFVSSNLQSTRFVDCDATTSTFDAVTVDDDTVMGIRGLIPGESIRGVRHEPSGEIYAPGGIAKLLQRLGAPIEKTEAKQPNYSPNATALIDLLERVARAYRRTNMIYETDERLHSLFGHESWPQLRKLMIEHGVITREMREARGANTPACRLRVNVDELLAGPSAADSPHSATAGLWAALRTS